MRFFNKIAEGAYVQTGINYRINSSDSKFLVILRIGRIILYYRRRADWIGGRRNIFDYHWNYKENITNDVHFDFNTLSVIVNDFQISLDQLEEFAAIAGKKIERKK